MKKRVIGIVGPTASGKTALSLLAGQRLGGDMLFMHSIHNNTDMDLDTAMPTKEEHALVLHHLQSFL